jgi:mono/diheme cytochrome c family protein
MKFVAGFVAAIVVICISALVVIITGAYNIAATVPHTGFERIIFSTTMRNSVLSRAGSDTEHVTGEEQVREGFREYNEMCITCHGAPGKEQSDIGKGLHPKPPDLAETLRRWNSAQLFWIVKNGVKMTGMPAFGPTHGDDQIWNIIAFVQRLPGMSADAYKAMEETSSRRGPAMDHHQHPGETKDHGH